mmetsp:Transcript_3546/g.10985  ORF Transcript_3546/g.10985 Transcript_3546/m.10985 type:complete len:192 (+) Transcript_3546:95-670(+)
MTAMKLAALATTLSLSSALGPLAPAIRASDLVPKKLGERWYTGFEAAYPNGAQDMPAAAPEGKGGLPGHDVELFEFWKAIHDQEDVYEVSLERPLGIVFEELGTPSKPAGVTVIEVQEGSNAAKAGRVEVGDVLVGVSAVRFIGGAYLGKPRPERDIFPASAMDFDTVVDAISSNDPPECQDVVLRLRRAA